MRKNGKTGKRRGNSTGTLQQDKKTKRYYVRFWVADEVTGKKSRRCRATGTDNLEQARLVLDQFAAEYGFEGATIRTNDLLTDKAIAKQKHFLDQIAKSRNAAEYAEQQQIKKRQLAEARRQAAAEKKAAEEQEAAAIDVKSAFVYYRTSTKRANSGDRTLSDYEQQYDRFTKWLAKNHPQVKKLRDVTPEIAEHFITDMKTSTAATTVNKYILTMRMIWKTLHFYKEAMIDFSPWADIRQLDANRIRRKELTIDGLRRTVAALRSEELKEPLSFTVRPKGNEDFKPYVADMRKPLFALTMILTYTGQRLGDGCTLTWQQIDLDAGEITFTPRKTQRKRGWTIRIPIHNVLRGYFESVPYEQRTGYLLPLLARIYLTQPGIITKRMQIAFRAAGLETNMDAPNGIGRKRVCIGCHSIRHFFSSFMSDNCKLNERQVDYLTSHDLSSTKNTYYHANMEIMGKAITSIPSITVPAGTVEAIESTDFSKVREIVDQTDKETLRKIRDYVAFRLEA